MQEHNGNRFRSVTQNGIPLLVSDLLPPHHGFAGRQGGVSTLPHLAELNVGDGLGDSEINVRRNLERIAAAAQSDAAHTVRAKQVHGNTVLRVTAEDCGRTDLMCDGFVTAEKGVLLLVKTADCVPILLGDRKNGVVCALHAGWRGSAARIAAAGIRAMCELGADRREITAAIGPCIGPCCYTVGEDTVQAFFNVSPQTAEICIRRASAQEAWHLDLPEWNRRTLIAEGISPANVAVAGVCTCCHTDRWFSHRGMHGKRGVMAAFIRL